MSRINLGNGKWFDGAKAKRWDESTTWNGNNHISDATGSQWDHEQLYRTAKGMWVLHCWSQWQGSRATYEIIDETSAIGWLIDNGHGDDVPAPALAENEV